MGHPLRFDVVELPQLLLVERPGPYLNVVVEMVRTVVVATTRPNFPVGIATDDWDTIGPIVWRVEEELSL